jgi:hypothetical protein
MQIEGGQNSETPALKANTDVCVQVGCRNAQSRPTCNACPPPVCLKSADAQRLQQDFCPTPTVMKTGLKAQQPPFLKLALCANCTGIHFAGHNVRVETILACRCCSRAAHCSRAGRSRGRGAHQAYPQHLPSSQTQRRSWQGGRCARPPGSSSRWARRRCAPEPVYFQHHVLSPLCGRPQRNAELAATPSWPQPRGPTRASSSRRCVAWPHLPAAFTAPKSPPCGCHAALPSPCAHEAEHRS